MAKITRKAAVQFGSSAGATQIGKFGSLAAGSVAYSTDPDAIQSLAEYIGGWYEATVGENSPAIQDMNALDYLWSYQIGYLCQTGVAEYNAATVYYIGSVVNDGTGQLFISLTDGNTGNALTSITNWKIVQQNDGTKIVSAGTTTTLTNQSNRRQVVTGVLTQSIVLPSAATLTFPWEFRIHNFSTGLVTVYANDGTTILAILAANGGDGSWAFFELTA